MKILYLSLGITDDYRTVKHVDAIRWTELYRSFKSLNLDIIVANTSILMTLNREESSQKVMNLIDEVDIVFIHHESCFRDLNALIGMEQLEIFSKKKPIVLQADLLDWLWLDLEFANYKHIFTCVCVGSREHAKEFSYHHMPLACCVRENVFEPTSKRVVLTGRYATWFNEKIEILHDCLAKYDFNYEIYTYPSDMQLISSKVKNLKNLTIEPAVSFAELPNLIKNTRFGLSFFSSPAPNGKVWDYLAMGLPVIHDENISESEMLLSEKAGIAIGSNGYINISEIENLRQIDHRKIMKSHSWNSRAESWLKIMQQI